MHGTIYEGTSESFRTESIMKHTLTFGIIRCCPLQSVMEAKLTRLIHEIVAERCTICSSRSRRPVRKLLDTHSNYFILESAFENRVLRKTFGPKTEDVTRGQKKSHPELHNLDS